MDDFVASLSADDGIDSNDIAELIDAYRDQRRLIDIGRALASEKDPDALIRLILEASMDITGADAGSIFLVEDEGDRHLLRFAWTRTHSRELPYEEFVMPADRRSIAGYVALTGATLNLPDVYEIDPAEPYVFNRGFDRDYGYRTRSMLVVPMRDHKGRVLGVVQLINSKEAPGEESDGASDRVMLKDEADFERRVVPFKKRYEGLMEAVAAQAAIALENGRMVRRLRDQFDSLVAASVAAIEARDPATRGHSERVARMALALAAAVHESAEGPLAAVHFEGDSLTELRYACLLHDFGKVLVEGSILLKARKLMPRDEDYLKLRLRYFRRLVELAESRVASRCDDPDEAADARAGAASAVESLLAAEELVGILASPSPTGLDADAEIARLRSLGVPAALSAALDEAPPPVLTDEEAESLAVRRGSLNKAERKLVEAHAQYTWDFVSKIPWPPELSRVPELALSHHEMLDGSGYPRGLSGDKIPMGSRIMAVCDVWDALSASDRPYKKALPPELCGRILREEAAMGRLDADLVKLFLERDLGSSAPPSAPPAATADAPPGHP